MEQSGDHRRTKIVNSTRRRLRPAIGLLMLSLIAAACGGSEPTALPGATTGTDVEQTSSPTGTGDASPSATETASAGQAGPPAGRPAEAMALEPAAELQGDAIRLGLITVTEGSPFASNGQRALEGAQYAVDEINAAGGIGGLPIELIVRDTLGSIESVTNIVRELVSQEQVLALVGPILSGECEVGCPLANELGTVVLSPGVGKPGVVQAAGPYAFSLVMPDPAHTRISLLPVLDQQGLESAVIFQDQKDPVSNFMGSQFWPALFEEAGVEVADVLTFTSGDPDFSAQVTTLAGVAPDALALAAGPADAARIAIEIERQGVETQLLGSGGLQSAGQDFIEAGGEAVNGAITAAQFDPEPDNEEQADLIESFETNSGSEVTLNSAYAYDAVYMLLDVIKQAGVTNAPDALADDRTRIKDGISQVVVDWLGMGGPTTVLEDGTTERPPQIGTIVDGEFQIEQLAE